MLTQIGQDCIVKNLDVSTIHISDTTSNNTEYMELLKEADYQIMRAYAITCLDKDGSTTTANRWTWLPSRNPVSHSLLT